MTPHRLLVAGLALAALVALTARAEGATLISWAGSVNANIPTGDLALGSPAGKTIFTVATYDAGQADAGTYFDFNQSTGYDSASLAALLGVTEAELAGANFIAFDPNGAATSFEGSTWTFSDGTDVITLTHTNTNPTLTPYRVAPSSPGYALGFGFNAQFGSSLTTPYVGVLLLSLPLDVLSPSFQATISGAMDGTPDVVALGVMSTVPEPASIALLGLGGAAFAARRRVLGRA